MSHTVISKFCDLRDTKKYFNKFSGDVEKLNMLSKDRRTKFSYFRFL